MKDSQRAKERNAVNVDLHKMEKEASKETPAAETINLIMEAQRNRDKTTKVLKDNMSKQSDDIKARLAERKRRAHSRQSLNRTTLQSSNLLS